MNEFNTDKMREEFEKWHSIETTFALGVPDDRTISDWWLEKFTAYRTALIESQAKCDDVFNEYIEPYVQKRLAEQRTVLTKEVTKVFEAANKREDRVELTDILDIINQNHEK